MKRKIIEIKIPKGFMNWGVSLDNYFTADTNDSANWDTLKFPLLLPSDGMRWVIKSNEKCNGMVQLIEIAKR